MSLISDTGQGAAIGTAIMPGVGTAVGAGAGLLFHGLSSLFGHKAKQKQADANRAADIAALTIKQKQAEDQRLAKLALGNSILSRVPATTAGGTVNTNVALDPELVKKLGIERTYDFASEVPKTVGGTDAFLAGLFGGAADTVPYLTKNGVASQPYDYSRTALEGPQPTTADVNAGSGNGALTAPNIRWEDLYGLG